MLTAEISKGVDKICKPLTTHLPIQIVSYARFYPNGRRICLSNSESFIQHFVEDHRFFRSVPNPTMASGTHSLVRISDVNAMIVTTDSSLKTLYENMMSDAVGIFKVQPPYSILVSKPGYYEEFGFFPSVHQIRAYETLVANHDTLRHFMFYFLEKAHDLIGQCKAQSYCNKELITSPKEVIDDTAFRSMKVKRYFFDKDSEDYLTKREAHCAHLITKNLSAREIADVMGISNRTAEDFIENIKVKSKISNKNKLQAFLCRGGFDRLWEFETPKH